MADIEAQPKPPSNFEKGPTDIGLDDNISTDISSGEVLDSGDELCRHLGMRQIQLLSIGGTIGTASFVSIGYALMRGGPAGLFLAFIFYSSLAEMAIFMPVSASFVRHGSKWVDDAWGFMAGWNFFWYEAIIIPFEITALNIILTFWSDDIPAGAVCAACIVTYALINVLAVKYFGEAEFWLCLGKIILILILFSMTFITMVGGNPKHDAYGFRYWRNPGAFVEYISAGNLGRFEGFLAALWQASFTVVGLEYIATVAGEAKHPRFTLKSAFKTVYARFGIIFIGGALCVSVVCPSNDPTLLAILGGEKSGSGTGAASPYIIAMNNMGITVLPHITNALLCTSIYSAGNTYVYCSTRALYSLALDGHAPKVLRKCTKHGVPIYAFAVVMIFPLLSLMQLENSSAVVLNWLNNLATAGGIINFIVMCVNYLFFYKALIAQGYSRQSLPYRGYFQLYGTWIAFLLLIMTVTYGYTVFLPGK